MRASIFFFAGNFADVVKRYWEGVPQIYQTHNEVAKLILCLSEAQCDLTIYSLVTSEAYEQSLLPNVRIIGLGSSDYKSEGRLRRAVASDRSDLIVAHFANPELLSSIVKKRDVRSFAVLANSYNSAGLRASYERWKVTRLLNNAKFEWVSNHCIPATKHLADLGVITSKLIPWDVPHPSNPELWSPKDCAKNRPFRLIYVGTISHSKGVGDLIKAIERLRSSGVDVTCELFGLGDLDLMRNLAKEVGVSEQLRFSGLIGNNEIVGRMRDADLVVIPSRRSYPEGFPLTMFEAIASRSPIVCSDHPMFKMHMIDGRSAVVFRSGDVESLSSAIEKVLFDHSLYSLLSRNAVETWKSLQGPACWRTMLQKWILEDDSTWLEQHSWRQLRELRMSG